jgi:transposase
VSSPHERTRERFLALYEMTAGASATGVAVRIGRHPQSVMQWVHAYNTGGPGAVVYRRTGGRPPRCPAIEAALGGVIEQAQQAAARPPSDDPAAPPRWTLRRLVRWGEPRFGRRLSTANEVSAFWAK